MKKSVNLWDDYHCEYMAYALANSRHLWMSGDSKESFANLIKTNKNDITYAPNSFGYDYNLHGFRSEEFDNSEAVKILYGGCSLTEGIGLPAKHRYSEFLNDHISNEIGKPIKNFNVGRGGYGIDAIVRYIYITIEHKGFMPDMVYLLLPSVMRQEVIAMNSCGNLQWFNFIPTFSMVGNDPAMKQLHANLCKTISYRQRYHDCFRNLIFLKSYLQTKGIPWFFGFWDNFTLHGEAFDDGIPLHNVMNSMAPPELAEHYINGFFVYDKDRNLMPEFGEGFEAKFLQTIARDGAHFGPNAHFDYAKKSYDQIIEKESFKDLITKWKS